MGTQWLQDLFSAFKANLEAQTYVDVVFSCHDGQVFAHKAVLSRASPYLRDLMNMFDQSETVSEVIVPDFSAFDLSDFIMALYGGPLPPDTWTFEQLSDLFRLSTSFKPATFRASNNWSADPGQALGQLCSEIEREFFPNIRPSQKGPEPVQPRYRPKRLPVNAQLLQLAKTSVVDTPSSSAAAATAVSAAKQIIPYALTDSVLGGGGDDVFETAAQVAAGVVDGNDDSGFHSLQFLPAVAAEDHLQGQETQTEQINPVDEAEPLNGEGEDQQMSVQDTSNDQSSVKTETFFWTCHACGERVPTQDLLRQHMIANHSTGAAATGHPCFFCPLKFASKQLRKSHETSRHPEFFEPGGAAKRRKVDPTKEKSSFDEEAAVCDACGESFAGRQRLNVHIRTHHGEKPFGCAECPSKFSSKFLLQEHLVVAHKDAVDLEKHDDVINFNAGS